MSQIRDGHSRAHDLLHRCRRRRAVSRVPSAGCRGSRTPWGCSVRLVPTRFSYLTASRPRPLWETLLVAINPPRLSQERARFSPGSTPAGVSSSGPGERGAGMAADLVRHQHALASQPLGMQLHLVGMGRVPPTFLLCAEKLLLVRSLSLSPTVPGF